MTASTAISRGWNASKIPDLSGQRYLVTGGTSGLGLETARALSRKGAHVTISARNAAKARALVEAGVASDVLELDLTDLASVRRAASRVQDPYRAVILNAGVMWTPYTLTVDGLELQMATNHFGHFAFAGLIKDRIEDRLVSVSSVYYRYGTFGDGSLEQMCERAQGMAPYSSKHAYGDSKLANLLFTEEIERRRVAAGWKFIAVTAHPGWSNTHLFDIATSQRSIVGRLANLSSRFLAQSAARGALPQLCAATWPGLVGGEFLGPRGLGELRGSPKIVRSAALTHDVALAANLWRVSEELTEVSWE